MAVELLDIAPAFADQMRRCDAALAEFVDWSLIEEVRGGVGSPNLDRVDVVQPVLFAVMVSLAAQWRALGIRPDAVLGHSQGEIAAAYVAGALSLRDATKVVALRSRAISAIAGTGGMVSISRTVQQVCALIEPWGQSISIAAQNGPSSTVITGNGTALDELIAVCERDEVPATRIPVDYASHSAHIEELRETLRESLSGLQPRTSDIAYISAVTGAGLETSILDGDYWFANLRQPVLFEQAVRWSYEHGYRTFIESSAHPVLTAGIEESLEDYDDHRVVATLRRNEGGMRRFLLSAAEAYVHGKSPDWESMFDDTGARRIDLPTYAFQRNGVSGDPFATVGNGRVAANLLKPACRTTRCRDEERPDVHGRNHVDNGSRRSRRGGSVVDGADDSQCAPEPSASDSTSERAKPAGRTETPPPVRDSLRFGDLPHVKGSQSTTGTRTGSAADGAATAGSSADESSPAASSSTASNSAGDDSSGGDAADS
jgi:acyl transferase domain-containing protein